MFTVCVKDLCIELCEYRQIAICESPHIWGVGGGGRGEEGGCVGEIGVSCVSVRAREEEARG